MKIKPGNIFPNVEVFQVSEKGPEAVSNEKITKNNKYY